MNEREPKQFNQGAKPTNPRPLEDAPRIESYEAFQVENAKLEAFVDRIEKNSPNGEIDIYNPNFWYSYRSFIENVWKTEYVPSAQGVEDEAKKNKAINYTFSGGSSVFCGGEHIMRMKQRSLLNEMKRNGVLPETLSLVKNALPLFLSARRIVWTS